MNHIQKLAVIGVLLAMSEEIGVPHDITPLEASKLQVKLMEFVEQHGSAANAEHVMNGEVKQYIRALYNDIMSESTTTVTATDNPTNEGDTT